MGRRAKPAPFVNVAATVEWRADEYNEHNDLFFLFRGLPQQNIEDAFKYLVGHGDGISFRAEVSEEKDAVRRIGYCSSRIAVKLVQPNLYFASIADMKILIEAVFKRLQPCSVKWMTVNRFLNV